MRSSKTIDRAAALWVARHELGSLSQEHQVAFDRWMAADPMHRAAYSRISNGLKSLDADGAVVRRADSTISVREKQQRRRLVAGATTGAIAIVALSMVDFPAQFADVRAAKGEIRQMKLADGSELWLDSGAALNIDLAGARRTVTLVRGRIHVNVAHEKRPFQVEAPGGTIVDVGTGFDVAREGYGVRAFVTDGTVEARHGAKRKLLNCGDGVSWQSSSGPMTSFSADLEEASWRSGWITFKDVPLSKVIDTLNSYSGKRLMLLNSAAGQRTVSGTIRTNQIDASTRSLAASQGLSVTDLGIVSILR